MRDRTSTAPAERELVVAQSHLAAALATPASNNGVSAPAAAGFGLRLSREAALYLLLIALAAVSRFWDLGSRTLHHDESLHAYFSWLFATGNPYVHDPLMHGPFLFHANALVYLLFGATDAASRFMPALCSTVIVGLPWFLRGPRQLGRWGALAAAVFLLFSPVMLYHGRYLRHDMFTVLGSFVLFIALVRYIEKPSRGWAIAMSVSLAFLLTNHEIVFGIAAIFLGAVGLALLWGPLRSLIPVVAVFGVAALVLVAKLPGWTGRPLPDIPWESPSQQQQINFYRDLLLNPLPVSLLLLCVLAVVAVALIVRRQRRPDREHEGWVASVLGDAEPGSVAYAVNAFWADKTGIGVCLALFGIIFAVFFTSLFTNVYGLASGTISTDGTLLYWLGQHDYRRGEQPWFYYILLLPQYEPTVVLLAIVASLTFSIRALAARLTHRPDNPRLFFQLLLVIWLVGIFLALTWAGEKMPWLILHITLPAILLAAALIGEFAERWRRAVLAHPTRVSWETPETLLTTALLLTAGSWFLIAARLTYGDFVASSTAGGWARNLPASNAAWWWLLALPPLAALALIVFGVARRGTRRTGAATLAAFLLGMLLVQVHIGWRTTYLEPDVPKDMIVYTQTSPDISRMTNDLTELSREVTGGEDLEIWFDGSTNGVAWPMQWYLRDFQKRHLFNGPLNAEPTAPVILIGTDNGRNSSSYLTNYTAQEYVLRWWFPEDNLYRDFAIAPEIDPGRSAWKTRSAPHGPLDILGSVASSLTTMLEPEAQQRLYRLIMYRDLPLRIESARYLVYVRNDLVPVFNEIHYGS